MRPKALLVGDGAREHVLAKWLAKSTYDPRIYAFVKHVNPGIKRIVEATGGDLYVAELDARGVEEAIRRFSPDVIVVGPEEPQFKGIVDRARELGVPAFGVTKRLAYIEMSKAFARSLMWRHRIPGRLAFAVFRDIKDAFEYVKNAGSVAIKPTRQVGGKGVRVFWDLKAYLKQAIEEAKGRQVLEVYEMTGKYGELEGYILVEEAVSGVEYTIQVITDGRDILPLPPVQDHPHVFENDVGPECGGMGSISGPGHSLPFLTKGEYEESVEIVRRSLEALQREVGERYTGVLSGQFMLTTYGPTLIEFYSRFGDPEVANVYALLDVDFYELVEAVVEGRLSSVKYRVRDEVSIVKAIAPLGYPHRKDLASGKTVIVDEEEIARRGCELFYGAVEERNGRLTTLGSRAVEVLAVDSDYERCYEKVERCMRYVSSPDTRLIYRRDIGSPELIRRRIEEAEGVRQVYTWRRKRGLGRIRIVWIPGGDIIIHDYS